MASLLDQTDVAKKKRVLLAKLALVRKDSPNDMTPQEISLLSELKKVTYSSEARNLFFEAIRRTKSPEQIEDLMNIFHPTVKYLADFFYELQDNTEDRNLGKNIIQASARVLPYSDDCGLIGFYSRLIEGSDDNNYPQDLVRDPEMAVEILKELNSKLQQENKQKGIGNIALNQTERFLYFDAKEWCDISIASRGNKSLRDNYQKLGETLYAIKSAQLEEQYKGYQKLTNDLFGSNEWQIIDKNLERY